MPPFKPSSNDQYKMLQMRLSQQRFQESVAVNQQKQYIREQRLQIAQDQAEAKAMVEYNQLQRQKQQFDDVKQASALLARTDPSSLNFPRVLSYIRGQYPLAFQASKDKQDLNVLDTVKSLEEEHKHILAYNIEQAKELGLTLDASNPGWDERTHKIDWDKARKTRELWNAQNATHAGATKDENGNWTGGVTLNAQSINEKGLTKYSNQQDLLDQKEDQINQRFQQRETDKAQAALNKSKDTLKRFEADLKGFGLMPGDFEDPNSWKINKAGMQEYATKDDKGVAITRTLAPADYQTFQNRFSALMHPQQQQTPPKNDAPASDAVTQIPGQPHIKAFFNQ